MIEQRVAEAEVLRLRGELSRKDRTIETLRGQLDQALRSADSLRTIKQAAANALSQVREQLTQTSVVLAEQRKTSADLVEATIQQDKMIERLQVQVRELESGVRTRDNDIDAQAKLLQEQDAELARRQEALADAELRARMAQEAKEEVALLLAQKEEQARIFSEQLRDLREGVVAGIQELSKQGRLTPAARAQVDGLLAELGVIEPAAQTEELLPQNHPFTPGR